MEPRIAGLLDKISAYPNIPRKKAKFKVSVLIITETYWIYCFLDPTVVEPGGLAFASDGSTSNIPGCNFSLI